MPAQAPQSHLIELRQKYHDKRYSYVRQLLLLSGGSLTALVGLNAGASTSGIPLYFLKASLASIGLGILGGSVFLYGEVWSARHSVPLMAEEYTRLGNLTAIERSLEHSKEISVNPTLWMIASELICYASLVCAILLLVAFALVR